VLSFYNLRSTTITPNSFQIRARMLLWKTTARVVDISDN
jgi:hypothetical protein